MCDVSYASFFFFRFLLMEDDTCYVFGEAKIALFPLGSLLIRGYSTVNFSTFLNIDRSCYIFFFSFSRPKGLLSFFRVLIKYLRLHFFLLRVAGLFFFF